MQAGTLRIGDMVVASASYGKVCIASTIACSEFTMAMRILLQVEYIPLGSGMLAQPVRFRGVDSPMYCMARNQA